MRSAALDAGDPRRRRSVLGARCSRRSRSGAFAPAWTKRLRPARLVLGKGGASMDAVEAAVRVLEDNPLFNAGRGAVFDAEGK